MMAQMQGMDEDMDEGTEGMDKGMGSIYQCRTGSLWNANAAVQATSACDLHRATWVLAG